MVIYSQRDPNWSNKLLGPSDCTMGHFGCTTTDVAQALTLAGHNVTPGDLVDALSANGGYTDSHYGESSPGANDGTSGLIIWSVVERLYPQFHYGGTGYIFQKGNWGKYQHWCLKTADGSWVSDPFFGAAKEPYGFSETPGSRTASIDPAVATPAPQPTPPPNPGYHFAINLKPDAEWDKITGGSDQWQNREEVGHLQDKLEALGMFAPSDLESEDQFHGYFGPRTIAAVVKFQIEKGILPAGSSYPATYGAGWIGPRTQEALNNS